MFDCNGRRADPSAGRRLRLYALALDSCSVGCPIFARSVRRGEISTALSQDFGDVPPDALMLEIRPLEALFCGRILRPQSKRRMPGAGCPIFARSVRKGGIPRLHPTWGPWRCCPASQYLKSSRTRWERTSAEAALKAPYFEGACCDLKAKGACSENGPCALESCLKARGYADSCRLRADSYRP